MRRAERGAPPTGPFPCYLSSNNCPNLIAARVTMSDNIAMYTKLFKFSWIYGLFVIGAFIFVLIGQVTGRELPWAISRVLLSMAMEALLVFALLFTPLPPLKNQKVERQRRICLMAIIILPFVLFICYESTGIYQLLTSK